MTRKVLVVCLLMLMTGCAVHLRNNHDNRDERNRTEEKRDRKSRDTDRERQDDHDRNYYYQR